MQTVFNSAYCVIAASRASGTSDGFLNSERHPAARAVVTFERGNEDPFYICEGIDDFQADVVDGSLNKRGWVFQERALARRTIFFTAKQTYWECGNGIRCETLTTLKNNQAAILGDPQFPKIVQNRARGDEIRHYESLYKQYSKLEFTEIEDRPIAISGLEQRLINVLGTDGGFGVLQNFLGRTLLWRRAPNIVRMSRIKFPPSMEVPSWSWMAYGGEITFVDAQFDGVDWEKKEILSPWSTIPRTGSMWHSAIGNHRQYLKITSRLLKMDKIRPKAHELIFDTAQQSEYQELRCVVIGRKRDEAKSSTQTQYILVVTQKSQGMFERVGVGVVPRDWILWDGPPARGCVC